MALAGIYVIHLLGLIYTTDIDYALKDLRIKLPLLTLPVIFSTGPPVSRKRIDLVLSVFIIAVLVATVVSMLVVTKIINYSVNDIRDISIFISHIRFSLLICLAIFAVIYLVFKYKSTATIILSATLIIWFGIFLFILESVTGFLVLMSAAFISLIIYLFKKPFTASTAVAVILLFLLPVSGFLYFKKLYEQATLYPEHEINNLKEYTASGNPYEHYTDRRDLENGHIVWININWDEMEVAWNQRSSYKFDSLDKKGQELKVTLVRFLTSKGLNKDKEGVNSLTDDELASVERGVTNVDDQEISNLRSRISEIFWEYETYKMYGNPGGHSVMQRVEFWKASLGILKNNSLVGVGTGDVNNAFVNYYKETDSSLDERWRLRAHNQYLSIAVAFGIIGLTYFLFAIIYPMSVTKKFNSFLYLSFWITAILSMISEDTLETQAGVTFFAFFNTFYLFYLPKDNTNQDTVEPLSPN